MTEEADGKNQGPLVLKAVYSPSSRKIACVLIAAAFGADRRVNSIVDPRDWFTYPADDMTVISGTVAEWESFATMKPDQRPGPEHFKNVA